MDWRSPLNFPSLHTLQTKQLLENCLRDGSVLNTHARNVEPVLACGLRSKNIADGHTNCDQEQFLSDRTAFGFAALGSVQPGGTTATRTWCLNPKHFPVHLHGAEREEMHATNMMWTQQSTKSATHLIFNFGPIQMMWFSFVKKNR